MFFSYHVRDHLPLKQGLRLQFNHKIRLKELVSQRPSSTKTRIKWNEIPRMFISDRWALVGFLRDVSFFGVLP